GLTLLKILLSMKYLFLLGAILAEIIGAIATRQSDGFNKFWPSCIAVIGVVGAYFLLSLSLKSGMPIGVAYGIWAALGITILAIIGVFFFKEPLSFIQVIGIIMIVGGVLALELGKAELTVRFVVYRYLCGNICYGQHLLSIIYFSEIRIIFFPGYPLLQL